MVLFRVKDQPVADGKREPQEAYNIATDALLVNGKSLHGKLHPVETGRLPDEVRSEALCHVVWDTLSPSQLETNLIRNICGESAREKKKVMGK